MLNDVEIRELFNVKGKNYVDRVIVTQTQTKYCKSFIRNKLMLRYPFEMAMQIVRDEITHKILAERPLLIKDSLNELLEVRENMEKCNTSFFSSKSLSELIPSYMTLINYMGIQSKKSKICNRLKNFITICQRFESHKLSQELFKNETEIQLNSLERKLRFYAKSDPADIIIYIFRYDVKK